ncbi:probable phytol kinase 1, chloroplastic isoform X2 [Carica papaya]|uniref:probable phytol kinase 1, chloroplastic isoform X2 n=1 Tax=Carica papaya TaxID=3649 RepID=UPI000B8D0EAE|nr:probable phytol kinase 1, chloroplastic isoform X2 [Carica papaya]
MAKRRKTNLLPAFYPPQTLFPFLVSKSIGSDNGFERTNMKMTLLSSPPLPLSSFHIHPFAVSLSPPILPAYRLVIRLSPPPRTVQLRSAVAALGNGALLRDIGATAAVLSGAYGLVSAFDNLTNRNLIQQDENRN